MTPTSRRPSGVSATAALPMGAARTAAAATGAAPTRATPVPTGAPPPGLFGVPDSVGATNIPAFRKGPSAPGLLFLTGESRIE